MKSLVINGHNGERYHIYCATDLKTYAEQIKKRGNQLVWAGADVTFWFVINSHQYPVDISNGYKWDGASIPKWARWIIGSPFREEFRFASMVHDDGYEERSERVINDVIFLYCLHVFGVPKWKADIMYKAVRAGGHIYYASDTSKFWRKIKEWL